MRRSRLLAALVVAAVAIIGYYASKQVNPVTGEKQAIAMTPEQEVALGLKSAPEMAAQFGGEDPDPAAQRFVQEVGRRVQSRSRAAQTPYQFHFTLLADPDTINAFALPGGPVFITRGLYRKLQKEGELAGVLGHEIGHVVGRHSSEQLAKSRLAQTLVGAAGVAASDSGHGGEAVQIGAFVAQMAQLRYGRQDELQADTLGVDFMSEAGYDPRGMVEVMKILESASNGQRPPEFLSSHPDPGNRVGVIQAEIEKKFPSGVPPELTEGGAIPK
jgi:beta-barrel assembly-enhancing protease